MSLQFGDEVFFLVYYFSFFFSFVQQNRSSGRSTCLAGVLLIVIVILWIHAFSLVVRPLCRVGPRLHRAVGVHQDSLK